MSFWVLAYRIGWFGSLPTTVFLDVQIAFRSSGIRVSDVEDGTLHAAGDRRHQLAVLATLDRVLRVIGCLTISVADPESFIPVAGESLEYRSGRPLTVRPEMQDYSTPGCQVFLYTSGCGAIGKSRIIHGTIKSGYGNGT